MIRLRNIKIKEDLNDEEILKKAIAKNNIKQEDVKKWCIYKKSIDARKKEDIFYNYIIDIELKNKKNEKKYEEIDELKFPEVKVSRKSKYRTGHKADR